MVLADRYAFIPKATFWQMQAGLLARPTFRRLPNNGLLSVTLVPESCKGLTATGIAPDFHRIPF